MSAMKFSFGIKTHLRNEAKTIMTIYSILAQNIPEDHFEIIVTGNTRFTMLEPSILSRLRLVEDQEAAANGLLGRMLNTLADKARFPHLCLLDDDIILSDGFLQSVTARVADRKYDALAFPIRNVDGSRFWDWAYVDEGSDTSKLLPYTASNDSVYVTGGMVLLRKDVWEQVKWDEGRGFYEREDVDWSERLRTSGFQIEFCNHAYVLHNDRRYAQTGDRVIRRSEDTPVPSVSWPDVVEDCIRNNPGVWDQLTPYLASESAGPVPVSPDTAQQKPGTNGPTIVLWVGRFSRNIGYAVAALSYVEALKAVGQPVVAFDLETMSMVGAAPSSPIEVKSYGNHIQISGTDPHANIVAVIHEIPTEYSRIGFRGRVKKVGYFVFETASIPAKWVQPTERFDQIWTASSFNKSTFASAGIPEEKIQVVPHCLDTSLLATERSKFPLPGAKGFKFLSVISNFNRKDLGLLLRSYYRTFQKSDDVTLIVKLPPEVDPQHWKKFVVESVEPEFKLSDASLPHVHFLKANLTHERLLDLYFSADVYVSVERGKGWDLPAMESMALGRPVISIDWGGSVDFLSDERSYLLKTDGLVDVDEHFVVGQDLYVGQKWARVDDSEMERCLKEAFTNPDLLKKKGEASRAFVHQHYNLREVGQQIKDRVAKMNFEDTDSPMSPVLYVSEKGSYRTKQIDELKQEIQDMKMSASWRLGHRLVMMAKVALNPLSLRKRNEMRV